jgi:hypothetical protein
MEALYRTQIVQVVSIKRHKETKGWNQGLPDKERKVLPTERWRAPPQERHATHGEEQ